MSKLENILKRFGRIIISSGLVASLVCGCSEESSIGPIKEPVIPPTQENHAPVFTSSPITYVNETEYYRYDFGASDADGDPVSFSFVEKPSWLSIISESVYGAAPEVSQDQNFNVKIRASDGKPDGNTDQSWTINVKNLFNSYLLTSAQINNLVSISENSLSFSQPVNFKVGDIIASDINAKIPNGILKEITSISNDQKTISVSQATLEQVVKDASLSYSVPLTPNLVNHSKFIGGASSFNKNYSDFAFNIDLKNVVLYDFDGNTNTKDDQLIANGNISFSNDLTLNFQISNHQMEEIFFKNSTHMSSDISVGLNYLGFSQTSEVKLAEYKFSPIIMGYLPTLIPIPVIVVPVLEVYAGISPSRLNSLSVRVKQDANLDVGLRYDGAWSPFSDFSNNFEYSNPAVNSDLELKVYAGPGLQLMLYGVAGPFGAISGILRLKYLNKNWELYGGLDASLGVKMDVFKKNVPVNISRIINYEKLIAKSTSQPIPTGEILFTSTRDGNAEVYLMNADGSNQTNLTNNLSHDYEAAWSPDKNKIVFVSERDGNPEIYTMNLNGTNLRRLTSSSGQFNNVDRMPNWSSNEEIAFYSERNGNREIFLMNSDGTNQRKLNIPFGVHGYPRWSGDGSKIVFMSTLAGQGNFDIYTINKDGTGLRKLTTSSSSDIEPTWCGNNKIVFSSDRTDNHYKIIIMNADGSNQNALPRTNSLTEDYTPSCSPDGTKIVYSSGNNDRSSSDIYIMNIDGSNRNKLTTRTSSHSNSTPFWK
jgi:TolB protein